MKLFVGLLLIVALSNFAFGVNAVGSREKRAKDTSDEESHAHADDSHADDDHAECVVSESLLSHEFLELAEDLRIYGEDGQVCSEVEGHEEEDHDHEEEGHEEDGHEEESHEEDGHEEEGHEEGRENGTDHVCDSYYQFGKQLLLRLNLTTPCCLGDEASCHDDEGPVTRSSRTPASKAYGYGFLMVVLVSLASLLGVLILPIARNPRLKNYYDYVYALLISLGASALFCDAVLHLIPEALGLHDHAVEESATGHAHSEDEREDELLVVWQSCVVILGLYAFFLFEYALHSLTSHSHSHSGVSHSSSAELANMKGFTSPSSENDGSNQEEGLVTKTDSDTMVDATFPHGTCHSNGSILHPSTEECGKKDCEKTEVKSYGKRCCNYIRNIKPLAWLILIGDSLHNFADGLALGAAISQSLSLGISTTIAIVFHEIPHELGDFFILLSTGMSWYAALGFNLISALTAIVGFFVGVAIGTASASANSWIIALAAGVFLYIALVDLLPELIHSKEKNACKRMVLFAMINIGFIISFIALLLLAIYEEDLNTLITV